MVAFIERIVKKFVYNASRDFVKDVCVVHKTVVVKYNVVEEGRKAYKLKDLTVLVIAEIIMNHV